MEGQEFKIIQDQIKTLSETLDSRFREIAEENRGMIQTLERMVARMEHGDEKFRAIEDREKHCVINQDMAVRYAVSRLPAVFGDLETMVDEFHQKKDMVSTAKKTGVSEGVKVFFMGIVTIAPWIIYAIFKFIKKGGLF